MANGYFETQLGKWGMPNTKVLERLSAEHLSWLDRGDDAIVSSVNVHYGYGVIRIDGPIPQTAIHKHHALQLSIARDQLRLEDVSCTSVLIDADVEHSLQARDALTLLINPQSHCAQILRSQWLSGANRVLDLPVVLGSTPTIETILSQLVGAFCLEIHKEPRIAKVLQWLDTMQEAGEWTEVNLGAALRVAALSESRFLHLFKQETGIAWRPALVWRRAVIAIGYAYDGLSLTAAAHRAGYADSAHLSRQFKANFGLTPKAVLNNSKFVQVSDGSALDTIYSDRIIGSNRE